MVYLRIRAKGVGAEEDAALIMRVERGNVVPAFSHVLEAILIPYRHGILHGMDLGYDNVTVAAESWAALFAAREWAL